MNYIEQINHFWAVQSTKDEIKPPEIAVYFYLLNLANRLNWPDTFQTSTTKLCASLGFNHRNTFKRSRDRLIESGVIEVAYHPTTKKATYSITKCATNRPQGVREVSSGCATDRNTYSKQTDKKTERVKDRENEGCSALSDYSFDELLEQAYADFPRRSDVDKCAEACLQYYQAKGIPLIYDKLKAWIAGEKHPEWKAEKPKEIPKAPENYEAAHLHLFGRKPRVSWEHLCRCDQEVAEQIVQVGRELSHKSSQSCATERARPVPRGVPRNDNHSVVQFESHRDSLRSLNSA